MRIAVALSRGALLLLAALGCGALSCDGSGIGSMACTLIGCEDQFMATLTVDATMVPAGMHTVQVTADGVVASCAFQFPPDVGLGVPCSSAFGLTIVPDQTIAGRFTERITFSGTPSLVEVQQLVGGTVIFDQTVSPTYQMNQPNGPGCGPICEQANVLWTIPQ